MIYRRCRLLCEPCSIAGKHSTDQLFLLGGKSAAEQGQPPCTLDGSSMSSLRSGHREGIAAGPGRRLGGGSEGFSRLCVGTGGQVPWAGPRCSVLCAGVCHARLWMEGEAWADIKPVPALWVRSPARVSPSSPLASQGCGFAPRLRCGPLHVAHMLPRGRGTRTECPLWEEPRAVRLCVLHLCGNERVPDFQVDTSPPGERPCLGGTFV